MDIGMVLQLDSGGGRVPTYQEVRALAQHAEREGLDALWLYDHLLFRGDGAPNGQWECMTMLGAIAEATSRVRIGTLVNCVAFRNPGVLAKIATALDEISGGRFVLGLGSGWNAGEFDAFGLPFDHRVDRFEEALQIIVPLVRTGVADFAGRYHQAHDCHDLPRGPRPNGPPIMLGAFGPRMLRLAARHADIINTTWPPADYAAQRSALDAACADEGRDPATLKLTATPWVAFPDLGAVPPHMHEAPFADAAAVAVQFATYHAAGVAEIMVDLRPNTPAAVTRLAEAVHQFRGTLG